MAKNTDTSKQKKSQKEKKEKVPKESAIYIRVTAEEEQMVNRLMLRYGKDKTSLILFALSKLRQRHDDVPPDDLGKHFVKPVLRLLTAIQHNPTLTLEHQELIKSTKAWAIKFFDKPEESIQNTPSAPSITTRPPVPIPVNDPDYFIDVDEIQAELRFLKEQITELRSATVALEQSPYRNNALNLLTYIKQSHDALLDAVR